jgi:hypothetical protein
MSDVEDGAEKTEAERLAELKKKRAFRKFTVRFLILIDIYIYIQN